MRTEIVECAVCRTCGAASVIVPSSDAGRECARCGGKRFDLIDVEVDASTFERSSYQFARCSECVNRWAAVSEDNCGASALVLCPFLQGRIGIRLDPAGIVHAGVECPFYRRSRDVPKAELIDLAMMGNVAAAVQLDRMGAAARCPVCGSMPNVDWKEVDWGVPSKQVEVRCGCGFCNAFRVPLDAYGIDNGDATRVYMIREVMEKWNRRALSVPALKRIMRMLEEHTVE